MNRASLGAVVAMLGLAALAPACRFGDLSASPEEELSVPTVPASRGPFRVVVREVGVLAAASSVSLRAPFHGRVAKLATEGSIVAADEPLLWMDTEDFEKRLLRRRQDVRAAEGELGKKLERMRLQEKSTTLDVEALDAASTYQGANLEQARREAADAERQASLGLIRRTEAETRQRGLVTAQLEHEQASAETGFKHEELRSSTRKLDVDRLEAERRFERRRRWLEQEEEQLERAVVRAPAGGRVFFPRVTLRGSREPRKIRVGDQISPWSGAVVELPETASLKVETQVDETLFEQVRPGTLAQVRLAALDDVVLPAQVSTVGFLAVRRSDSAGSGFRERSQNEAEEQVVFPVQLELERLEPRLQAGMSVAVTFLLESFEDVVSVPVATIFGSPEAPVVLVRGVTGLREQPVRLGPTSEGEVVVLEGLEGNERLYLGDPRTTS